MSKVNKIDWRSLVYYEDKRCTSCGKTKPTSEFHRNESNEDGLQGQCIECHEISMHYPGGMKQYREDKGIPVPDDYYQHKKKRKRRKK